MTLLLYVTVFLSISLWISLWFILPSKPCEIFQNCDQLLIKLEKDKNGLFCINETTSALQSFHVYRKHNCEEVNSFTNKQVQDIYTILNICFTHENKIQNYSKLTNDKYCSYQYKYKSICICFDVGRTLSIIQISDNVELVPQDAYHLYIYLKLFSL
jgi:hypothetical protein